MLAQLKNSTPERFDYLSGVGSGGCTDIDALYERHGNFLFIENKRPNEELSKGQLIALRALAALPQADVLVVYGNPPDELVSCGYLDDEQEPTNVVMVRSLVQQWWDTH